MENLEVYAKAAAFLGAAIAMGLGGLGPAIGQGLVGMKACENIGKYPKNAGQIRATMFLSMVMVETSAIYALVISLFLIFRG